MTSRQRQIGDDTYRIIQILPSNRPGTHHRKSRLHEEDQSTREDEQPIDDLGNGHEVGGDQSRILDGLVVGGGLNPVRHTLQNVLYLITMLCRAALVYG
jgi:hypothetical protein